MSCLRSTFEERGYTVLSVYKNRKQQLVIRTDRGEFNATLGIFPIEFNENDVKNTMSQLKPSF